MPYTLDLLRNALRSPSNLIVRYPPGNRSKSSSLYRLQYRTMASLPKIMNGVLVEQTGGTEVLQFSSDLPVPSPKEHEVLVKNSVVGVNYIDTYFRTGLYSSPKPEILGKEGAGI